MIPDFLMPEPVDPRLTAYMRFLREMDAISLGAYRAEAADLAEDDDADGRLARALLPIVDAVLVEAELREELRPLLEADVPGVDVNEVWPLLLTINRGRRQLGLSTDASEVFDAALDVIERTPPNASD